MRGKRKKKGTRGGGDQLARTWGVVIQQKNFITVPADGDVAALEPPPSLDITPCFCLFWSGMPRLPPVRPLPRAPPCHLQPPAPRRQRRIDQPDRVADVHLAGLQSPARSIISVICDAAEEAANQHALPSATWYLLRVSQGHKRRRVHDILPRHKIHARQPPLRHG